MACHTAGRIITAYVRLTLINIKRYEPGSLTINVAVQGPYDHIVTYCLIHRGWFITPCNISRHVC